MADPQRISITICGDGGTGKSSITLRLVRSQWMHDYDPTIEDSYSVTRTIDGTPILLSLTDTAGQEEYRGLISSCYMTSDAFLLVYDITSPSSLHDQLPYFLDLIMMEREIRAERAGPAWQGRKKGEANYREDWRDVDPVVIVAGNKCDLKQDRRVTAQEGLEWARQHGCGFMETSARECVNVEETFALIVRRVLAARQAHAPNKYGSAPVSPVKSKLKPGKVALPSAEPSAHSFARTQPLTPLNEKENRLEERRADRERRWWEKLKCC